MSAKPFLKWAGGKRQLIGELDKRLPITIKESKQIGTYIEPFVGGGSFFFYLASQYSIQKSILIDVNEDLILTYITIQSKPKSLIKRLLAIQTYYHRLAEDEKKKYFYHTRQKHNEEKPTFDYTKPSAKWALRSANIIFLNHTCFNGLFRENSKGEFNVPFGSYVNPTICDAENITAVSKALEHTILLRGDFSLSKKYVKKNALIYLDPPYRPISKSSSFTAYSKNGFNDDDQKKLKEYVDNVTTSKAHVILSNSDPKNGGKSDHFFDDLYRDYKIERVNANRNINSKGSNRSSISELIISNTLYTK